MKKQISIYAGIRVGLFVLPLLAGAQTDGWELEKNEAGIQISTRKPEGSAVKAFRGVTIASASVDEAVALFEKSETVCEWVYQCSEFLILEDKSPEEKMIYFHQDMPWPVSDRDVVYHRLRQIDAATGAVTFALTGIKDASPEKNAGVRLASLNGQWRFTPLEGGRMEILYEQHVDPGGSLPKWLVNRLVVEVPFETLKEFRAMLEKEKDATRL